MPNIKFSYLYRDSANYKKYDYVAFANPENIDLSKLEALIKSKLIDGTWFYAEEWNLPELFLSTCDFRYDPTWHEFENVEYSDDVPEALISLNELIASIELTKLPW
jgi:hypothetical protein